MPTAAAPPPPSLHARIIHLARDGDGILDSPVSEARVAALQQCVNGSGASLSCVVGSGVDAMVMLRLQHGLSGYKCLWQRCMTPTHATYLIVACCMAQLAILCGSVTTAPALCSFLSLPKTLCTAPAWPVAATVTAFLCTGAACARCTGGNACSRLLFSIVNRCAFCMDRGRLYQQYRLCRAQSVKRYAPDVPKVTVMRLAQDCWAYRLLLGVACYEMPADATIQVPAACDALDMLRGQHRDASDGRPTCGDPSCGIVVAIAVVPEAQTHCWELAQFLRRSGLRVCLLGRHRNVVVGVKCVPTDKGTWNTRVTCVGCCDGWPFEGVDVHMRLSAPPPPPVAPPPPAADCEGGDDCGPPL